MKFQEEITKLKNDLKALITNDSDTKFIESITALDKELDNIVSAHKETETELQSAKNTLVEYIKNTGFKKPASDDSTPPQEKDLDSVLKEELKQFNEKEKK